MHVIRSRARGQHQTPAGTRTFSRGIDRASSPPHPLRLGEVRSVIAEFSSDIETILHDLRSEGVLIKTNTGYKVAAERLALGMGLYLSEDLCVAHDQGKDVGECLRDLLSPHQETDEMVAWLRSATIVALFGDPPKPKQVVDVLVHEWLSSRNLSHSDFQEVGAIRHLLLHPLLRIAPQVWSAKRTDGATFPTRRTSRGYYPLTPDNRESR
jgi:hypothetical protein